MRARTRHTLIATLVLGATAAASTSSAQAADITPIPIPGSYVSITPIPIPESYVFVPSIPIPIPTLKTVALR